jgi:hypothetical protein
VFAAPAIRIEAVGETAEGSDWHVFPFVRKLLVTQVRLALFLFRSAGRGRSCR